MGHHCELVSALEFRQHFGRVLATLTLFLALAKSDGVLVAESDEVGAAMVVLLRVSALLLQQEAACF